MSAVHSRELADTLQAIRLERGKKRCRYCGAETLSSIGVCLAHTDLPELDTTEPGGSNLAETNTAGLRGGESTA